MKADRQRGFRGARAAARALLLTLILALFVLPATPAPAQPQPQPQKNPTLQEIQEGSSGRIWDAWEKEADEAEKIISAPGAAPEALDQVRSDLEAQRTNAKAISDAAATEVARLTREQDALGPAPAEGETESADVARLRADLQGRISAMRAVQVRADRIISRAGDLLSKVVGVAQRRFIDRMTTLGPSPANPANWLAALETLRETATRIGSEVRRNLADAAEEAALRERAPIILLAFGAAALILFGMRGLIYALMRRAAASVERRATVLALSIGAALARLATLMLVAAGVMIGLAETGLAGVAGTALLEGVAAGLGWFILLYVLSMTYFSPSSPAMRITPLDDRRAAQGHRGAMLVGAALIMDSILTGAAGATGVGGGASAVASFISILIGAVGLWRIASLARRMDKRETGDETSRQFAAVLRRLHWAVAAGAPLLSLIGYEAAARYLFFPFVHTMMLYGAARLIMRAVGEAVEISIERGPAATGAVGDDHEEEPGHGRLGLVPILVATALILVCLPLLALIWGASLADLGAAWSAMAEGVTVGEISISPVVFLVFALVFSIGYVLTRGLQRLLRNTILPKAGMSAGGAEALVAGAGYIGLMLATVAAISSAGIDLSNLALVAGALTVGIGFGLQNIVNNFVSGIILLIERPVKVGDWIEVGGVNGYVRKVNVRSTVIDTFDRSSYILPNSDLIAGAVTNFTLSDKIGRVIVPVGVAYGADSRLVERVLLEIGRGHRMVLAYPGPVAYFMGFGDSSLNFELRVMIRDVNWIVAVRSELNHQIYERLAKEGVEIPFPQRDLRIRDIGGFAEAFPPRAPTETRSPE
ncbi:MAG: DUF3772 domain-containing protein [Pikeienuella sp.]